METIFVAFCCCIAIVNACKKFGVEVAALAGGLRNGMNGFAPADIYDFTRLEPGNRLAGPAVIHTPITTIAVQADQTARMDGYRNIILDLEG